MKQLRKLFYRLFVRYKRLELRFLNYADADKLLKENEQVSEPNKWYLAKEEDTNHIIGMVYLERKERITQ